MPESPVTFNRATIPPAGTLTGREDETLATVAFLPPLVSRTLIVAWFLLFSARWLIVQAMIAAGAFGLDELEKAARLERIDGAMGRCYLLLLSISLVTLAARIVLSMQPAKRSGRAAADPDTRAGAVKAPAHEISAREGAVEADKADRGGKQT